VTQLIDHVSLPRADTPYEYQEENTGHEYEVRRHTGSRQKYNRNVPNQQFRHFDSESAVAEGGMVRKHQVGNPKSGSWGAANDVSMQETPSHVSSTYGEQEHENEYGEPEGMKLGNPEGSSLLSDYKIPWEKNLSKNDREIKEKYVSGRLHGLKQAGYRHGNFDSRTDSRVESVPSFDTDSATEVKQSNPDQPNVVYKSQDKSFKSFKPLPRNKISGPTKSQYEKAPTERHPGRGSLTYQGRRQDAVEEKELYQNMYAQNEYDDGLKNDNAPEYEDSNMQPQEMYQAGNDYSIHSRIERLKNRVRGELAEEF
jgi:hypothetical protein